jgi:hypothetical protein
VTLVRFGFLRGDGRVDLVGSLLVFLVGLLFVVGEALRRGDDAGAVAEGRLVAVLTSELLR